MATIWMLLSAAGAEGMAVPLAAAVAEGARGQGVRRVEVKEASAEIRESAEAGTNLIYDILSRERYLGRHVVVRYAANATLANVHGRSADLAFALSFAASACPRVEIRSAAVTGTTAEDGSVGAVEEISGKLAAALSVLPPGGAFIFPAANESGIPYELCDAAATRKVRLCPVTRIEQALEHLGLAVSGVWLECPYRGLEPFEPRHAAVFCGRRKEAEELAELLAKRAAKGTAALLIHGPSGSGKTSLALAGVVPHLLRSGGLLESGRWALLRPRSVRPDPDPETELANLECALQSARDSRGSGGGLVLVLDQMEEWLQGTYQLATIVRLGSSLAGLAQGGAWLIGTVTSSGLAAMEKHPELAALFGAEGRYALHGQAAVEEIVREPARAAKLRFEPGLDAEIIASASHCGPDVLPLLELLLTELYERRDLSHNEMWLDDYRAVDGLEGVVSVRAEEAYRQCAASEQEALPHLLWKLSASGEVLPGDYPQGHPIHGLLSVLREKRLLVEDRNAEGRASLRPAHEALLRNWARAAEERSRGEADIALWRDVARESGQWARKERALIPAGPQLEAVRSLDKHRAADWTASDGLAVEYMRASLRQHARRRLLGALAVGLPTIAAGGAGIVFARNYLESLHTTRLRFDGISVPGPDFAVAAAPYLKASGVSVEKCSPERANLLIRSNIGLYGGRAAYPKGSENFLVQESNPPTAPLSYTLAFERPVREVRLLRAALWAATGSGVTHPAWRAAVLDAAGNAVDTAGEEVLGSHVSIPEKEFTLKSESGSAIARLRIESDFRLNGVPFAGFQSVLIQQLQLIW